MTTQPFKQVYERHPLTRANIDRVNEINFNQLLLHLSDVFGSPMMLGTFLTTMATYIGISPDELNIVANKSFKNPTLPVKNDELIEIYYRSDFSRREIQRLLRIGDKRITDVVAQNPSAIQEPIFTQAEALVATRFVRFFTEVAEQVI